MHDAVSTRLCSRLLPHRADRPAGYELVMDSEFDANLHLSLEQPAELVSLDTLGNAETLLSSVPSHLALTSTFRVLSVAGVSAVRAAVARQQGAGHEQSSDRIPRVLRGAGLRSKFLSALSEDASLLKFLSDLAGCALIPHPMSIMHAHVNLQPKDRSLSVDRWHRDTVGFVLVIFLDDKYVGGELQYMPLPYARAVEAAAREDADSIAVAAGKQLVGWACFMQGSQVLHRAKAAACNRERTTLVLAFEAADVRPTARSCDALAKTYHGIDPHHVLLPQWARFISWRASQHLAQLLASRIIALGEVNSPVGLKFPATSASALLQQAAVRSADIAFVASARLAASRLPAMVTVPLVSNATTATPSRSYSTPRVGAIFAALLLLPLALALELVSLLIRGQRPRHGDDGSCDDNDCREVYNLGEARGILHRLTCATVRAVVVVVSFGRLCWVAAHVPYTDDRSILVDLLRWAAHPLEQYLSWASEDPHAADSTGRPIYRAVSEIHGAISDIRGLEASKMAYV